MRKNADHVLMKSLYETCGEAIGRATGSDVVLSAVLAALTANGSGGASGAFRFSPLLYQALTKRLRGIRSSAVLAPRRDLERYLKKFRQELAAEKLLQRLASFHGYTLIAGYHAVRWNATLEKLTDPAAHFDHANQLVQEYCGKHDLQLPEDLAKLGHLWTTWRGLRNSSVSMYVGRLRMRFDVYRRILTQEVGRAA